MKGPEDPGEHRVANALREALPTRRHGEMLLDIAAEMLGPTGLVESDAEGSHRVLYRIEGSDPRWVVPWPVLTLDRNPRKFAPIDIPGLTPARPLPPRP